MGLTGLRVSRIGLGMMSYGDPASAPWFLDEQAAEPIVRRAVEGGVTLFDTADMYSDGRSEEITGRLLRKFFPQRDDYVLATKVFYPTGSGPNDRGLSRKHVMAAVEDSLRRLDTDHIDLYQIHRWDSATPVEETLQALDDLVRAGKVRYLGASLMFAWQFAKAQHAAVLGRLTPFAAMQTRYNLVYREEEREMLPLCADQGVGVLPYSPLARGVLARGVPTGQNRGTARSAAEGDGDHEPAVVTALQAVADERGLPPARIALAWLLGRPTVCAPIVGVTRPEQLDDALAAVDLVLDAEEVTRLESPYRPRRPFDYQPVPQEGR